MCLTDWIQTEFCSGAKIASILKVPKSLKGCISNTLVVGIPPLAQIYLKEFSTQAKGY